MNKALWIGIAITVIVVVAHVGLFLAFVRPSPKEEDDDE